MLFKSAIAFRVNDLKMEPLEINEILEKRKFIPCDKFQESTAGWIKPYGPEAGEYAPYINGVMLLAFQIQEKTVSKGEIDAEVDEDIKKMIEKDPRAHITKALKKELASQAKSRLMTTASSKYKQIFAMYDSIESAMYISASEKGAQDFVESFLITTGQDEAVIYPIITKVNSGTRMREWILNSRDQQGNKKESTYLPRPEAISIANDIKLEGSDSDKITYSSSDILNDDLMHQYLDEGKEILYMSINFQDIQFRQNNDFSVASIKWSDSIKETIAEQIQENSIDEIGNITLEHAGRQIRALFKYTLEECFDGEGEHLDPHEADDQLDDEEADSEQ